MECYYEAYIFNALILLNFYKYTKINLISTIIYFE